jgi:hypothetical protein
MNILKYDVFLLFPQFEDLFFFFFFWKAIAV